MLQPLRGKDVAAYELSGLQVPRCLPRGCELRRRRLRILCSCLAERGTGSGLWRAFPDCRTSQLRASRHPVSSSGWTRTATGTGLRGRDCRRTGTAPARLSSTTGATSLVARSRMGRTAVVRSAASSSASIRPLAGPALRPGALRPPSQPPTQRRRRTRGESSLVAVSAPDTRPWPPPPSSTQDPRMAGRLGLRLCSQGRRPTVVSPMG